METIESFARLDADLGSQFITEKEITLKFSGDELRLLNNFMEEGALLNKQELNCNPFLACSEDEQQVIKELLEHILDGVSNYTLA
jgi:hypothetical protein|tara:strand:+ start:846 stop:1100 length:255 start_codon:yes stop_codon:yes gene_type:complete